MMAATATTEANVIAGVSGRIAMRRQILARLRAWLAWIVAAILSADDHPDRQYQVVTSA